MPLFLRFAIVLAMAAGVATAQETISRQVSITFKQGVKIKSGAPIYWKNERVGSVKASKHNRELHQSIVEASVEGAGIPASLAAVVVIQGGDEKKEQSLRIELLPSSRPPQDPIPGYGSFEEFWLARGAKSGR